MFNKEQQEYINYLAKMAPQDLCYCGWYSRGECPNCPSDLTAADKIKLRCEKCGNAPSSPGDPLRHTIKCPER